MHPRPQHADHLAQLETIRDFDTTQSGPHGRRMLLGLFADDEVRSMASAEVSHSSGLVVSKCLVYPAEINNPDSTTTLRMVHALHLLAEAIDTPLNMDALRETAAPWLGALVSEVDED